MHKLSIAVMVLLCLMSTPMVAKYGYDSYVTYSIDASNVLTQTVVVEGTSTMNPQYQCTYQCGQYKWCTIPGCPPIHTPKIFNQLGGSGGWNTGGSYSPADHILYQVTTQVQGSGTQSVSACYQAQVNCTMGGLMLDTGSVCQGLTPVQHDYPTVPVVGDNHQCWISSFFDAVRGKRVHHALDVLFTNGTNPIYVPNNTPVYAMESGTVVAAVSANGPSTLGYPACASTLPAAPGNYVKIQNAVDHYFTVYFHVTPTVTVNTQVIMGQQIGNTDNSGCQSGEHVHVERKDENNTPVNFTIPCINRRPNGFLYDGLADDYVPPTL
jgi:murein DD-endopeptidase MepM/ murein hydrolase activator NlpD